MILIIVRNFYTALHQDSLISQRLLNHKILQLLKGNPSKVIRKPLPQQDKLIQIIKVTTLLQKPKLPS